MHPADSLEVIFGMKTILPALCDKMFKFCDSTNTLRTPCPNTICCRTCNTIQHVRSCAEKERHRNGTYMQEVLKTSFSGLVSSIIQLGPKYGVSVDVLDDVLASTEWAAGTIVSILKDSNSTSWRSCMRACKEVYVPRANWYGQSSTCLRAENRSWVDPSETNASKLSNGTNIEPVCDCDARARSWTHSVLAWHGCAVCVAAVLIGLQTFVAVHMDHEEMRSCRGGAAAAPACPKSLCGAGDKGGHSREVGSGIGSSSSSAPSTYAQGLALSSTLSLLLIGCLLTELGFIAASASGPACANRGRVSVRWTLNTEDEHQNLNFTKSWALLSVVLLSVTMFAGIMPIVRWMGGVFDDVIIGGDERGAQSRNISRSLTEIHQRSGIHCDDLETSPKCENNGIGGCSIDADGKRSMSHRMAAKTRRWARKCMQFKQNYDELFSFRRGRYYVYLHIVFEMVEVGTQTVQLILFAHERPLTWLVPLSTMLVLNGLCMPVPFMLARCFPVCKRRMRLFLTGADMVFDMAFLLLAVLFSKKDSFGNDTTWWVAVLSIAIPVISLTRRLGSIRSSVSARRRTAGGVAGAEWRGLDRGHKKVDTKNTDATKRNSVFADANRVTISLSFLISVYCIACGGVFFRMASEGDAACRIMLGDSLWEGANPKVVILRSTSSGGWLLRGGCNFNMIEEIDSTAAAAFRPPLERLPPALAQLKNLKSLVLSGHHIASDGVSANILDGTAFPRLTQLTFGEDDPVSYALSLSGTDTFPRYVMRFMTDLEVLRMRNTNISCFPPRSNFSRLRKLRELDLSGTRIDYLPPSVLFEQPQLESLNLSGTPVWRSLDWSAHGLGLTPVFAQNFHSLARALPMLESLNLSWNGLRKASALNLSALPRLERLDVSHNPELTPPATASFSWWNVLSTHPTLGGPNARFIGLANVGLRPEHVQLARSTEGVTGTAGLTCDELHWMRDTMTDDARVDLSGNCKFARFIKWFEYEDSTSVRGNMECQCLKELECAINVDEGIFRLLQRLIPNMQAMDVRSLFHPDIHKYSKIISMQHLISRAVEAGSKLTGISLIDLGRYDQFPVALGALKNLEFLNLKHTVFTRAAIPEGVLENWTKLQSLKLSDCELSGPIPTGISDLTNLLDLDLTSNNFTGTIPSSITQLSRLQKLDLCLTGLQGNLPAGFEEMRELQSLSLPANVTISSGRSRIGELCYSNKLSDTDCVVFNKCEDP